MSLGTMFAGAAGTIFTLAVLASSFYTVSQKEEALVSRLGKYTGEPKDAGLHVKRPWPIDKVEAKISLAQREVNDELETKTEDNIFVKLPIAIQFEVDDTEKFHFDNEDPINQIKSIVNSAVRKYTSDKTFQSLYNDREQISESVIADVATQMEDYGVDLKRIVIDQPNAPESLQMAYNNVAASEREKDAAQNKAEAAYIMDVKRAEADKQRNILIGEGVAGFRETVAMSYTTVRKTLIDELGVDPSMADRFMEEAMRLDTLRDIGDKGNMIVVTDKSGNQAHSIDTAELVTQLAALNVPFNATKTPDSGPKLG